MSSLKSGRKQKPNYFRRPQKNRRHALEPNLKGFLCSCNNNEKECIREAYNLLNRYTDVSETETTESNENLNVPKQPEDIEDNLAQEIADLKSQQVRKFQVMDSGAKNFLFIRTTLEDPVKLAEKIMIDLQESKQKKTRFLLRLVPVEMTCKAYIKDIEKAIEPILEKYFKTEARTFSIIFNHRNNDNLSKDELIKVVADKVTSLRADHKVNLKEAELSIIIEIIRNIALLSVVPNFFKFKKYNLHSICEANQSAENAECTSSAEVVEEPE